jgi:hypothetical protein
LSSQTISNLTNAVSSMLLELANMGAVPPFNNSFHSFQQTASQINLLLAQLNGLVGQTGVVTAGPPVDVLQSNLAAGRNWALGNGTLANLAASYVVGAYQNGQPCPATAPYAAGGVCVNCTSGYFDLATQTCVACAHFNVTTQTCGPYVPPPPPPPVNTTNITVVPPPPPPVQYVTNTTIPSGLILPSGVTLSAYQAQLAASGQNLVPCPGSTPYFDGTVCIGCGSGQLFDVAIKTCQTCPVGTTYSVLNYSCLSTKYYTNITLAGNWVSVVKNFTQLQQTILAIAALPNGQACPAATPFFDGSQCIACSPSAPFFSFDSNTCVNCGAGTVFSPNVHLCVIVQQRQTSLASPNLVLGGLSLNEWKYFHANNQTANPQLSNCPGSAPYFDGQTCISCVPPTPYFSLTHLVCINCAAGTTYSTSVMECLSSSGNIVTQNPTLVKMAAGIFA